MIGIKIKNNLLAQNLVSFYPKQLEIFQIKKTYEALLSDSENINFEGPILYINCPKKINNINTPFRLEEFESSIKNLFMQAVELKFYIWQSPKRLLKNKQSEQIFTLTQKEAELIDFLLKSPYHQAHKEALLNGVWHYHEKAQTHTIETHLYHLRKKLGQKAPPLIELKKDTYHLL